MVPLLPAPAVVTHGWTCAVNASGNSNCETYQVVDPKPVAMGLTTPLGLDVAPPGFGDYAGQIFVTDVGDIQVPVP